MRGKFMVSAALVAASLGLVGPAADAYRRGTGPAITEASCSSDDMVYVSWDKGAGRPSHLLVTLNFTEQFSSRIDIPKSRIAKGRWAFSVAPGIDIDSGDYATILLNDDNLQGDYVGVVCGP